MASSNNTHDSPDSSDSAQKLLIKLTQIAHKLDDSNQPTSEQLDAVIGLYEQAKGSDNFLSLYQEYFDALGINPFDDPRSLVIACEFEKLTTPRSQKHESSHSHPHPILLTQWQQEVEKRDCWFSLHFTTNGIKLGVKNSADGKHYVTSTLRGDRRVPMHYSIPDTGTTLLTTPTIPVKFSSPRPGQSGLKVTELSGVVFPRDSLMMVLGRNISGPVLLHNWSKTGKETSITVEVDCDAAIDDFDARQRTLSMVLPQLRRDAAAGKFTKQVVAWMIKAVKANMKSEEDPAKPGFYLWFWHNQTSSKSSPRKGPASKPASKSGPSRQIVFKRFESWMKADGLESGFPGGIPFVLPDLVGLTEGIGLDIGWQVLVTFFKHLPNTYSLLRLLTTEGKLGSITDEMVAVFLKKELSSKMKLFQYLDKQGEEKDYVILLARLLLVQLGMSAFPASKFKVDDMLERANTLRFHLFHENGDPFTDGFANFRCEKHLVKVTFHHVVISDFDNKHLVIDRETGLVVEPNAKATGGGSAQETRHQSTKKTGGRGSTPESFAHAASASKRKKATSRMSSPKHNKHPEKATPSPKPKAKPKAKPKDGPLICDMETILGFPDGVTRFTRIGNRNIAVITSDENFVLCFSTHQAKEFMSCPINPDAQLMIGDDCSWLDELPTGVVLNGTTGKAAFTTTCESHPEINAAYTALRTKAEAEKAAAEHATLIVKRRAAMAAAANAEAAKTAADKTAKIDEYRAQLMAAANADQAKADQAPAAPADPGWKMVGNPQQIRTKIDRFVTDQMDENPTWIVLDTGLIVMKLSANWKKKHPETDLPEKFSEIAKDVILDYIDSSKEEADALLEDA